MILELLEGGGIAISRRLSGIKPLNARQSDLNRVLSVARANELALRDLWRTLHGIADMTDEELEAPLDAEIEAAITEALERAKCAPDPITAVSVHFSKEDRLLIIALSTGQGLAIPQEDLQHLADVSPDVATEVTMEMLGMGLHWEKLDLDFSVESLLEGRRGSKLHERWRGESNLALQVA